MNVRRIFKLNCCLGMQKNHQKCGYDNIFFFPFGSSHPFIFEFMHPINSLNLARVKKSPTDGNIVNIIHFLTRKSFQFFSLNFQFNQFGSLTLIRFWKFQF